MSLGTYNSKGNNKKNDYSPVTYSPVKFFNSDSKIDPSTLNFSFWKSLLKVSITPLKVVQGSATEMDKDNNIDIYLSPMKAKLFLQYAEDFRKNPNKFTNVGIGTNKGIIYLTSGKSEFNTESLFVVIKLMNFEEGTVTSCIAYEFNRNNFGITDYAGGTEFNKNYDFAEFVEFDMFLDVIRSYVESVNYAIAATVVDNNKFDVARISNKIGSIQEKLGIETGKKSYNGSSNNSSYWNNNGSSNSSSSPAMNTSSGSSNGPEQYDNLNQLVDDISSILVED